jgi:hypothetical protein
VQKTTQTISNLFFFLFSLFSKSPSPLSLISMASFLQKKTLKYC